jgi:hypothetical protein
LLRVSDYVCARECDVAPWVSNDVEQCVSSSPGGTSPLWTCLSELVPSVSVKLFVLLLLSGKEALVYSRYNTLVTEVSFLGFLRYTDFFLLLLVFSCII